MYLAFFIGLLSSTHCVLMCGPLLWSLPIERKTRVRLLAKQVVYHIGRILTYSLLGLLVGLLGSENLFKGVSQYISLFSGVFLLLLGSVSLLAKYVPQIALQQHRLLLPFLNTIGYWLNRPGGHFMVGLLNGFLPCGMVYMALAFAINTGSALTGARFMMFFGLGTLPLLLGASLLGGYFKSRMKLRLATWLPLLFLLLGIWFTFRGANLDIPYLSPALQPKAINITTCR